MARYLHIHPRLPLPELAAQPFRAVLIAEQPVSEDWRNQVAAWLVKTGCLYASTWGIDCEAWHDSVDWANIDAFDFGDIPDQNFVMTTWHTDAPLSEVFWFAENCATHPTVELCETVVIHVAEEAQASRILQAYRDAQELADKD